MFFIAVLWRASICQRDFYKKICLGAMENVGRRLILDRAPGTLDNFQTVVAKWDNTWEPIVSNPCILNAEEDGSIAMIPMLDFIVYIKIDGKPMNEEMAQFVVGADKDLFVLSRCFADSKDRKIVVKASKTFFQ